MNVSAGLQISQVLIFGAVLLFSSLPLVASERGEGEPLKVGVFDKPPFAMKEDDQWQGLAVNLWERIATKLSLDYSYVELLPSEALEDVRLGRVDLLVGELSTSADREREVDFSQPYLAQPMGAAVKDSLLYPHWIDFLRQLPGHGLFQVLGIMFIGLVIFSLIIWFVERTYESSHFTGSPLAGFGKAIWFAVVTMTTVGYGDTTPKTVLGRTIALLWMFFGILVVSGLTATVASTVAVARVTNRVEHADDLIRYKVGVQQGTLAEQVIKSSGLIPDVFETAEEAFAALEKDRITAFVADRATLQYLVNNRGASRITINTLQTTWGHYALAARENLNLMEAINIALLEIIAQPDWQNAERQWITVYPGEGQ